MREGVWLRKCDSVWRMGLPRNGDTAISDAGQRKAKVDRNSAVRSSELCAIYRDIDSLINQVWQDGC
jgi:hypothetical protein